MTEVMQVREAYRVEQWRQLMQQRKDSPLNNREFCAQQGISEKSYYYWLKKRLHLSTTVITRKPHKDIGNIYPHLLPEEC